MSASRSATKRDWNVLLFFVVATAIATAAVAVRRSSVLFSSVIAKCVGVTIKAEKKWNGFDDSCNVRLLAGDVKMQKIFHMTPRTTAAREREIEREKFQGEKEYNLTNHSCLTMQLRDREKTHLCHLGQMFVHWCCYCCCSCCCCCCISNANDAHNMLLSMYLFYFGLCMLEILLLSSFIFSSFSFGGYNNFQRF